MADAEPVLFRAAAHEPGPRTILGVRYGEPGREQGPAVLRDLAAKPATARFVCAKLARHFVADDPPPALTARLERAWTDSRGDLGRVAEALISAPEAWSPQPAKFKAPYEFVVSSYRAAGVVPSSVDKLAPILTAVQLLKSRDHSAAREAAIIERQTQHMVRLVDDLLDVSRIVHGKIELRRGPVELGAVAQRACEIARPAIAQREHMLLLDIAPGTVVFLCSTYAPDDLPSSARTCGAAAYVHKEELSPDLLRRLWAEHAPVTPS